MVRENEKGLSRREFCFCCTVAAGFLATGGWLTPSQAFARREILSICSDLDTEHFASIAVAPLTL